MSTPPLLPDGSTGATPLARARPSLAFSHEQLAHVLQRIRGQTTLPEYRVWQVLTEAISVVAIRPANTHVEPLESVVMLATERLWAEEKAGAERSGTASARRV